MDKGQSLWLLMSLLPPKPPALGDNGLVALGVVIEAAVYIACLRASRLLFLMTLPSYAKLSAKDKRDWDFRVASNVHALAISAATLVLFLLTDLFVEDEFHPGPLVSRSSWITNLALGFSLGFFLVDTLFMLSNPSILGGPVMLTHHVVSLAALVATALWHEAHNYTLLALATECTTPFLNTRWMLDKVGMRDSLAYTVNGVGILVMWLLGRIVLFLLSFRHLLHHAHEILLLSWVTLLFVVIVPLPLFALNLFWFSRIVRGALKLFLGSPEQKARHAEEDTAAFFTKSHAQKEE